MCVMQRVARVRLRLLKLYSSCAALQTNRQFPVSMLAANALFSFRKCPRNSVDTGDHLELVYIMANAPDYLYCDGGVGLCHRYGSGARCIWAAPGAHGGDPMEETPGGCGQAGRSPGCSGKRLIFGRGAKVSSYVLYWSCVANVGQMPPGHLRPPKTAVADICPRT